VKSEPSGSPAADERFRLVLEAMTDAVLVVDESGRVRMANPAAERVLGVAADELTRLTLRKAVGSAGLERVIEEARDTGAEAEDEVDLRWPARRRLRVKAAPLSSEDRTVVAVIADVSKPRRVEQMRRDFVANVSHELKTPVAALTVAADSLGMALEDEDLEAARRFADRLAAEVARLGDLTRDLLTLSRIQTTAPGATGPVDLGDIVRRVVERLAHEAERKSLAVRVDVPADMPQVAGDADDFESLVQNLIDNAVRYTEVGSVAVTLAPAEESVVLAVKDTGLGIPRRDLDRVFERFYRVEKSRARHTGGTGLGLSIVRNIADTYGLGLELKSAEDAGTTVTVTFPQA
jgi:PAS domain S-box-containing protein